MIYWLLDIHGIDLGLHLLKNLPGARSALGARKKSSDHSLDIAVEIDDEISNEEIRFAFPDGESISQPLTCTALTEEIFDDLCCGVRNDDELASPTVYLNSTRFSQLLRSRIIELDSAWIKQDASGHIVMEAPSNQCIARKLSARRKNGSPADLRIRQPNGALEYYRAKIGRLEIPVDTAQPLYAVLNQFTFIK